MDAAEDAVCTWAPRSLLGSPQRKEYLNHGIHERNLRPRQVGGARGRRRIGDPAKVAQVVLQVAAIDEPPTRL